MFTLPTLKLPSFLTSDPSNDQRRYPSITLPRVLATHDVETSAERRARTLKHLLLANHANHAVLHGDGGEKDNGMAQLLGSAYVLGGSREHLNDVYERRTAGLEGWVDAPGEVAREDWRDYTGRKEYQRAFVDFFEDQLVARRYDWKGLLQEYLFEGEAPLVNGLVSGLAHPLVHLGYAYELDSRTLAIEALALAACCYGDVHKYLDDARYTQASPVRATSLLDVLQKVRADARFDGVYEDGGDISKVLASPSAEAGILEYWNAWDVSGDAAGQFEASQRVAVALLVGTAHDSGQFDGSLAQVVAASHAVRVLLPRVPAKFHVGLVRQWWLLALGAYVAAGRPEIKVERVTGYEVQGRDWRFVTERALGSGYSLDGQFVKGLRAMKAAAETWGDADGFYLGASVRFADEFRRWSGEEEEGEGEEEGEDDVAETYPELKQ